MTTIALTGGIASGKSTIARRLAERGARILDADVFAREAVAPGSPGLARVRERFGDGVIASDGALDRAALASIVFRDAHARADLNAIVHPEVRRLTGEALARIRKDDPEAVVIHDIPLLVEAQSNYDYDEIWVADAPAATRIARLVAERGMSAEDAAARVGAQADDAQRRALADVLIDTTAPLAETLRQVDALWARLAG